MQHASSMKEQLASQFNCVMIEGMGNNGYAFDIAVPTANIKVAELEENLDIMVREVSADERHFQTLVWAGERMSDRENWGIYLDGKLFHDGYDTEKQAHAKMQDLIDEMDQFYGQDYGFQAALRLTVECVEKFPRSRWLSKLSHRMRMHMVQIDQTHKLLAAVGQ